MTDKRKTATTAMITTRTAVQKGRLHPRNQHSGRYDLAALCQVEPKLKDFLLKTPDQKDTIDFSNNRALICLNKALLARYYGVAHWDIPADYLCPPIPGRADYIHYIADLLAMENSDQVPRGGKVSVIDIGTGANCVYPILGTRMYGWRFKASDIDDGAIKNANLIVNSNACLTKQITLIKQKQPLKLLAGLIKQQDKIDLTLCNPPFHASAKEALAAASMKQSKLTEQKQRGQQTKTLDKGPNFGGKHNELWCQGGEIAFLTRLLNESADFQHNVLWFTALVSKKENVRTLEKRAARLGAAEFKVISMSQGQKISRAIAWTYKSPSARVEWARLRWSQQK